jgi:hypothetical protein
MVQICILGGWFVSQEEDDEVVEWLDFCYAGDEQLVDVVAEMVDFI